jgi:plasmid stabilization system protein ParE
MKVEWSRRAIRHLTAIRRFIEKDADASPALVASRILATVDLLQTHPELLPVFQGRQRWPTKL